MEEIRRAMISGAELNGRGVTDTRPKRTERGCAGKKAEARGIKQHHHTGGIARLDGRWQHKFSRRDLAAFEGGIDADFVRLDPVSRKTDAKRLPHAPQQEDPITPPCTNRSDPGENPLCITHPPKSNSHGVRSQ